MQRQFSVRVCSNTKISWNIKISLQPDFVFISKSSVSGFSRFENTYFNFQEKNIIFFLICPLRHRGGGAKGLSGNVR